MRGYLASLWYASSLTYRIVRQEMLNLYLHMVSLAFDTSALCWVCAGMLGERGFGVGCSCSFRMRC
jgi:hypothetical protein